MRFSQFEHKILPHILAPLIGGLFVILMAHNAARAEPPRTPKSFIISTADGYGVNDCIKSGEDCARIVADAWCSAHGHANAVAFGSASDITGSIENASSRPPRRMHEDDVFITCGE